MSSKVSSRGTFDLKEDSSEPFVVKRAKQLLASELRRKSVVRITYIALKKRLISEFGETEFGRNKATIQKLLEEAVCSENPNLVKNLTEHAKDVCEDSKKVSNLNIVESHNKSVTGSLKSPRLYFYKMNQEDTGAAEGNRYISNDDL
eukprot:g821.t1